MKAGLMSVVVVVGCLLGSPVAVAFNCTVTETGGPSLAWDDREVVLNVVMQDGDEVSAEELVAVLEDMTGVWNTPSCSDFRLSLGPPAEDPRALFDWAAGAGSPPNENIVVFRTDVRDETGVDAWLHPAGALAITTVTFVRSSGRILDTDIEINDASFQFSTCDPEVCVVQHDLANMLAHELGHVVGLDHPPSNVPGASETTMYASAGAGETLKRDLAADDIDGLCAIYPAGADNVLCPGAGPRADPPAITLEEAGLLAQLSAGGCTCAALPAGPAGAMLGLLAALGALWDALRRGRAPVRGRGRKRA